MTIPMGMVSVPQSSPATRYQYIMFEEIIRNARAHLGIPQTIDLSAYDNLLDMFHRAAREHADRPAFSSLGRTLTFGELERLSRDFAAWLQQRAGVQPGDRVAIQLPNVVQYPVVLFGAMRAGAVVVNTNPLYTAREAEHQFKDADVTVLILLANVAHEVQHILSHTSIRRVVIVEIADLHPPVRRFLLNSAARYLKRMVPPYHIPDAVRLPAILREGRSLPLNEHRPGGRDVAVLQYTGGTTGVAKGAMLSHHNLVANALQCEGIFASVGYQKGSETLVLPLPLYHIYAFTVSMVMMNSGNHTVLIPNPRDIPGMVRELSHWRFTGFIGLNTLFVALCNHAAFRQLDFAPLKMTLSGGMALTRAGWETWKTVTGVEVCEGYGLTETSPVVSVNPGNGIRQGTIGIPIPDTYVRVIDDNGHDLGVEQPGELCVKGPQVMLGYWKRDDETAKVLQPDGWLHTGDIAVMASDGYLRIVDRKKDMITVSGFKVFPNEIEDVICLHPGVLECAAIGVPDERSGEVVKVFIVRRDPALTEEDIRRYCSENFTGYKIPRQIEFRDALPKSNVGKVLRKELR